MNSMKTLTSLIIITSFFSISLNAQLNNHHKNYIEIGYVGGLQNSNSAIGGVYGSLGFFFKAFGRPASLDFKSKEVYISNPDQQGTLLTLTYRVSLVKGLFVGIGGAHGHQISMADFLINPAAAIGGTHRNINHSTGFHSELGYNFKSFIKNKYLGIYPTINIGYTHLLAANLSEPNLTLNAGFRFGLKQWECK